MVTIYDLQFPLCLRWYHDRHDDYHAISGSFCIFPAHFILDIGASGCIASPGIGHGGNPISVLEAGFYFYTLIVTGVIMALSLFLDRCFDGVKATTER